jgi:hypothetical protein
MNTVPFTNTSAGVVFPSPTTTKVFNPLYGPIRAELYDGVSSYNGLQTALVKKFAHGFNMQIAYTWSKSIDDSSDTFSDNESLNSVNNPIPYWTAFSRGPSNFNIGQNFVLNAQYVIPVPTSWSGVAKTALGGWQLGGIATLQSGTPFTPMISGDPAGTQLGGDSDQRPNVVAGCNAINSGQLQYVNVSCLTPPAIGVIYNDIGRNRLVGPPMKNLDFSLFKNFAVPKISEKFNVQFRMEAFNATNHVNFYAPGSASNDTFFSFSKNAFTPVAGAGLLNNAWPGREIQFGLKFTF